jgi:hypothetical protein
MHLYREGLAQFPTTLQPSKLTRSGYAFEPVSSAVEGFGQTGPPTQPARPVFDVQCPAGCPPVAAAECRPIVRRAIIEAIKQAENAANKIDEAIKVPPDMRNAEAKKTAGFFTTFFGHDPSHPISWAGNEASGVSVAKRFRAVARELGGGRRIVFRCVLATCPAGSPSTPGDVAHPACCSVDSRAFFVPGAPALRNVVHLCPPFWTLPAASRGGTIIHEMLHLLYPEFLHHGFRRPNAHCYKAFALRVKGHGRDLLATCSCWGLPIGDECRQRVGL